MSVRNTFEVVMAKVTMCEHGFSCNTCCWPWQGGLNKDGYPHVKFNGKFTTANRVILEHVLGTVLLSKEYALHTCDSRACCSWHHLYKGDHQRNTQDRCERNPGKGHSHKLTHPQVYQIRRLRYSGGWGIADLCKHFPVKRSTMQRILTHEDYPHMKGELLIR